MPANRTPIRDLIAPLALGTVAVGLAGWFSAAAPGLPLDDGYIHLTFARNFADGLGFAFNPGEHSLGFSSPLWVLLLALADAMGLDGENSARWLAAVFFGGAAALVLLTVLASMPRKTFSPAFAAAAAAGFALCGNLLWLAGSGMETMLYLALGLTAILLLAGPSPRPIAGGIALGLVVLARPNGLLLGIILIGALLAARKLKPALTAAASAAVLSLPWFVYSFASTGFILPPTRAGKLASNLVNSGLSVRGIETFLTRHLIYFYQAGPEVLWCLPVIVAGLVILRNSAGEDDAPATPKPNRFALSPAAALGLWAALDFLSHALFFRTTASTTPMHYLRYEPMLIPALIAGAAAVAGHAAGALKLKGRVLLLLALLPPAILGAPRVSDWRQLHLRHAAQIHDEHRAAALYIRDHLPGDARVACLDIGALGYFSGRYVIDLGGLIDPAILPLLEKRSTGPFLIERRATHYLEMVRHDSERILGVRADDGHLYDLIPIRSFNYPPYSAPLLLHSLGMNLYEVQPR